MLVSAPKGDFVYKTAEETAEHIRRSSLLPSGDLWVSFEDRKYPCLAILVNGEFACVHYFENEDGDMWLSFVENGTQEITFVAGGTDWEAPPDSVVSLENAISCVYEFCDTAKRPQCIKWQNL